MCTCDRFVGVHVYWSVYAWVLPYVCTHAHTDRCSKGTVFWLNCNNIHVHRYSMCTDLMLDVQVYICTHTQTGAAEILCTDWIRYINIHRLYVVNWKHAHTRVAQITCIERNRYKYTHRYWTGYKHKVNYIHVHRCNTGYVYLLN